MKYDIWKGLKTIIEMMIVNLPIVLIVIFVSVLVIVLMDKLGLMRKD